MSASRKLRKLNEDVRHYNQAFLLWQRRTDFIGTVERWCQSVFRKDIIPQLSGALDVPEGKELRTLGVGSGAGEVECHILKEVLLKFPRISNHVIEPSKERSDSYKSYVSENSENLKGIDYNWHLQTMQEYKAKCDSEGIDTKFHLISAVHSLYYVENLGYWIDRLYDMLEDGGMLFVIMTAELCGQGHINREFLQQPNWGQSNEAISERRDCTGFTINNALAHFENRGISHDDFIVPLRCDISQCLSGEPAVESDLLLDFFSNVINFRRNVDDDLYKHFLEVLASDNCSERQGGRVLFIDDIGVTVAFK